MENDMKEVDPQSTSRALAFQLWMKAPMPMVTLMKTLDVTTLVRLVRKRGYKFNMLLCWCIGKAARSNRTRPGRENTLDNGEEDFHAPAVCRHWQDCDGRILSQQNKSLKVAGLNGCNTW